MSLVISCQELVNNFSYWMIIKMGSLFLVCYQIQVCYIKGHYHDSLTGTLEREFHQYLARFKQRRTYANVANDRTVPYWTAAMEITNHFEIMKDLDM